MLDKLPYMCESWHSIRRYVHITIIMCQVEYGSEAPSTLRHCKHTRIETSTTWRGFYCSLSKKLINLLLNNRMISYCHLDIKMPEVTEQGRMGPKLKMVTQNHIKLIREPPGHTGNESTLDIPKGGSGQDIKKEQNGKYMPFMRTCWSWNMFLT